jgi:hypothetical protein
MEMESQVESNRKKTALPGRITEKADALGVPWDLTEWIDQEQLVDWIERDVETLDWENPNLVACLRAHPEFQPKMLLRLLVYAYGTGIFNSEEIVAGCYENPRLRAVCAGPAPRRAEIIAFRRENIGLLKWFLLELFKRTLKAKFGEFLIPAGLKERLVESATTRLDMARHIDRGGA